MGLLISLRVGKHSQLLAKSDVKLTGNLVMALSSVPENQRYETTKTRCKPSGRLRQLLIPPTG